MTNNAVNYLGNEVHMNSKVGFSAASYKILSKFEQNLFFSSASLKPSFTMGSRGGWSLMPLVMATASLLIAPALRKAQNPTVIGCWCIHRQRFLHTPQWKRLLLHLTILTLSFSPKWMVSWKSQLKNSCCHYPGWPALVGFHPNLAADVICSFHKNKLFSNKFSKTLTT